MGDLACLPVSVPLTDLILISVENSGSGLDSLTQEIWPMYFDPEPGYLPKNGYVLYHKMIFTKFSGSKLQTHKHTFIFIYNYLIN